MPWLMDELAIYCFHCLLGNTSKWLRALLRWQRRWLVEWFEQHSTVNNNMVGVVYNSITTTRQWRKRQKPTVTGDISVESHSQYLASAPTAIYDWGFSSCIQSIVCAHFSLLLPLPQGKQTNTETYGGKMFFYKLHEFSAANAKKKTKTLLAKM